MLTTGAMTRLGYVYGNLMVNLHLKNSKLAERGVNILEEACGIGRLEARKLLKTARNNVPVALVIAKTGVPRAKAVQVLTGVRGNVRKAINMAEASQTAKQLKK
jgi:N-acetylmuramic acid 6-phosphate etherase